MRIIDERDHSRRLLEEVLARPLFAHLSTLHENVPRESPVWFLWEDRCLWIVGNYKWDSFPKRIEKEPACAVGIVDFNPETGLVQHVGFRGRAFLEPQEASRVERLFNRYMGEKERWDPRFQKVLGDRDWVFVRFEPETAVVRDQSYSVGE
ncbi:pyridoxamine 5'-phosphate oxidase family protein [Alteribacter natronophilus]|uniref:pyridoxamine 5'-phosphate oxidase family protein n=1 Tax=Alteribacter natronophilus TaxID=2583810 RepID=UPI00110D8F82|nr:pyridoxamine 5'-phosphate oxidase family protein [Alteribacter natronophilus]TMW70984.1 pyridoxamine 5'-phosphate oxidase family protein [Alteribacter natronophilus]